MAHIKDGPRVMHRVSFTAEEDGIIQTRAIIVGMGVVSYIRHQALHGKVRGYPLAPLTQHEDAIGEIVYAVREIAARPHPDRWLYEADFELLEGKLDELIKIEVKILELLRRRMA